MLILGQFLSTLQKRKVRSVFVLLIRTVSFKCSYYPPSHKKENSAKRSQALTVTRATQPKRERERGRYGDTFSTPCRRIENVINRTCGKFCTKSMLTVWAFCLIMETKRIVFDSYSVTVPVLYTRSTVQHLTSTIPSNTIEHFAESISFEYYSMIFPRTIERKDKRRAKREKNGDRERDREEIDQDKNIKEVGEKASMLEWTNRLRPLIDNGQCRPQSNL